MTDERVEGDEIKSLTAHDEWRPIETAPKDGTIIWIYAPPAHGLPALQTQCAWHPDAGFCVCELREPTHWMPLPFAPEKAKLVKP